MILIPDLRIFSLSTLQIRALTACPDPQPTPFVSPVTIAYIHRDGLIFDSVTALQTDSTTTRALRCETIARQKLESMPLAKFHDELRLALTSYYEGIVKMEGASDINKKVAYKRPIKRISLEIQAPPPPAHDADSEAAPAAAGAAAPDAAGAAALAAAAAATPPHPGKAGSEGAKAKSVEQ